MLRVSRCTAFLGLGHGRHHVSDGIYLGNKQIKMAGVSNTDIYLSGLLARCQNAWSQDGGNMRVIANGIDHWPALSSACVRFLFCFVCFFRVIWVFQDKIQLYKPKVFVFNEWFPLLRHFYTLIVKTGQGNLLSLVLKFLFICFCFAFIRVVFFCLKSYKLFGKFSLFTVNKNI